MMGNRIKLTKKAMGVLTALITLKEDGHDVVRQPELRKKFNSNIDVVLYTLQSHGCVRLSKIKNVTHATTLIYREDLIRFSLKPSHNVKPRVKQKNIEKPCPYNGRRYQDVPKGTRDAAMHCRVVPTKQHNHSFGNSAGMCVDA